MWKNYIFNFLVKFAEVPFEIQNGLFGIIGLLPKAFEKEKIVLLDYIDIFGLVEYMKESISKNKIVARKLPILISKWIKFFPGFKFSFFYKIK